MKKYEINTWGDLYKNPNNAGFKAPGDADKIYARNGYKVIRLPSITFLYKLHLGIAYRFLFVFSLLFRFDKNTEVHVQLTSSRIAGILVKLVRLRTKKITLLVHDVNFLRYDKYLAEKEIRLYNSASEIIVHTPAMAAALKQHGVVVPMKILTLFDYFARAGEMNIEAGIRSIVFAGNLQKSAFIKLLIKEAAAWDLDAYLYGAGNLTEIKGKTFWHYEGVFEPDDISRLKGAWGLVWDGKFVSTCDAYLKYNAPHKLSLYLAAGKPVIIWRQSALHDFVTENKLGIAVDSLLDIPAKLAQITEEDYRGYIEKVRIISAKLKSGDFLSACLSS